jgi:cation transport ATPase
LGGSINTNGSLEIKVTKAAADSTIARIIHLVESAREQKAQTQSFLDDLEQKYSLGVVIFTLLVWWIPIWFWVKASLRPFTGP